MLNSTFSSDSEWHHFSSRTRSVAPGLRYARLKPTSAGIKLSRTCSKLQQRLSLHSSPNNLALSTVQDPSTGSHIFIISATNQDGPLRFATLVAGYESEQTPEGCLTSSEPILMVALFLHQAQVSTYRRIGAGTRGCYAYDASLCNAILSIVENLVSVQTMHAT